MRVPDDRPWYSLRAAEAPGAAGSDATSGLTRFEAARRLERLGPNALPEPPRPTWVSIFLHQFTSPLTYLLLVAALLALALRNRGDAVVICAVVLLNAAVGTIQEGRAEASLRALRRLVQGKANVIRDGVAVTVDAREVVPGDVLLVAAGDRIAADARLIEAASLQTGEAALTGESLPVDKDVQALPGDTVLADRRNMIHAGTHVTAGRGRAVVVATGGSTEVGRIGALAASAPQPKTPLERRIVRFGRYLIAASAVLFVLVVAVGLVRAVPPAQIVMVAISQVVGLIPEGLPVSLTIALAVGVQRMARRRAVVRRLSAVETLGCTTVICTDKTGTLTRNELTVTAIYLPGGRALEVTGTGYGPEGRLLEEGLPISGDAEQALAALLEACVLCNDAQLVPADASDPRWRAIGDPTEAALLTAALKGGLEPADVRARFPREAEIPFDAAAKLMATQHRTAAGAKVVIKGAPEAILELCGRASTGDRGEPSGDARRAEVDAAAERMAARALRLLAFAVVEGAAIDPAARFEPFRGRAKLLGLVGEIDPPRPEVAAAVLHCRSAGIRPVMVTGDHRTTALAIARALAICRDDEVAIDGRELDRLSSKDLAAHVNRISVFARVRPEQKLRIVEAHQQNGEIVAMTGDGVNDAPALARADVGVAMGITGTEVAKEAAKMVVADDNFATIVGAVEEGRIVYRNLRKVILLLCSTSLAEVIVLMGAMLLGCPVPFTAVQILWNNLVTEGLITVNLVMEPAEGDEMQVPPVARDEALVPPRQLRRIALMSAAIVACTLGWFVARLSAGVPFPQVRTETFTMLVVCEWFNVLNCRSETRSALSLGLLRNPWLLGGLAVSNLLQAAVVFWAPLRGVFNTVPLGWTGFLAIGAAGSVVLWAEEATKLLRRRRGTAVPVPGGKRVR